MRYLGFLILVIGVLAIFGCADQTSLDQKTSWSDLSAGWEKTISYRAGDDRARELEAFEQRYEEAVDKNAHAGKENNGNGVEKVVICHIPPGNPGNAHTIVVGEPAVEAHLAHGDYLGPCEDESEWEENWDVDDEGEITNYTCYASEVVELVQGLRNNGTAVEDARSDVTKALGTPQDNDTINFLALGFGGYAIFTFDGRVANYEGMDLKLVETSYGSPTCDQYPEYAHVYASQDGETWTDLGVGCQDSEFDLGDLEWAKYIKVVDETNPDDFSAVVDGFDIDGLEAVCVDEPDDGGDLDDLIDPDEEDCDSFEPLDIDISIDYLNPTAGFYQGYPNFYMGGTMNYHVNLTNNSADQYHHLTVAATFEYNDMCVPSHTRLGTCPDPGTILQGQAIQEWVNVTIPPGETLVLQDTYYLHPNNEPTFFQTHVIIQRYSGRCLDGALVFDDPTAGIMFDPIP